MLFFIWQLSEDEGPVHKRHTSTKPAIKNAMVKNRTGKPETEQGHFKPNVFSNNSPGVYAFIFSTILHQPQNLFHWKAIFIVEHSPNTCIWQEFKFWQFLVIKVCHINYIAHHFICPLGQKNAGGGGAGGAIGSDRRRPSIKSASSRHQQGAERVPSTASTRRGSLSRNTAAGMDHSRPANNDRYVVQQVQR